MSKPNRYKRDFGSEGRVTYPRVRVSVGGDGWLEVVVCRNRREYAGPTSPEHMLISPRAAEKLRDALAAAVPTARHEEAARLKRRQRHEQRHPTPNAFCRLCDLRKLREAAKPQKETP